jgi:hypothetical protein
MAKSSKFPDASNTVFFERGVKNHDRVDLLTRISEGYYEIVRFGMSPVKVIITNFYTLGYGELCDFLNDYPEANCIVVINSWNSYTEQAYLEGKDRGVGVFDLRDFYGALNCEYPSEYIRQADRKDN